MHNSIFICESSDLAAGCIRRNTGEAVVEPVLVEFGQVNDRALRGPSAQVRWAREVAVTHLRRESLGDAPGRAFLSRLWSLPTHVVYQSLRRMDPRQPSLIRESKRSNAEVMMMSDVAFSMLHMAGHDTECFSKSCCASVTNTEIAGDPQDLDLAARVFSTRSHNAQLQRLTGFKHIHLPFQTATPKSSPWPAQTRPSNSPQPPPSPPPVFSVL